MATTEKYYKIKSGLEAPSQDTLQVTESTRPTIRPSLNLNFAQAKVLDPRITFARTSTATYYDGKTVAKAEENLLQYSQEFDNAYWTKTNITVTANSTTAPDGTTTAESILETATTGQHQVFRNALITSSNTHVRSVFAKPNGRNWLAIYGATGRSFFDLQNGVTGTVEAGYTASMIDVGNGWYRCILIGPAGTNSYAGLYNIANANNSISYAGDITKGLFIWGAQFEQRSAPTAYTPTTTQPITNYIPALQTAASGMARFDHDPVTTESLGLLIEEQRTNLFPWSEVVNSGFPANVNAAMIRESDVAIAPDGTLTADKIIQTGAGTPGVFKTGITTVNGTVYTTSIYAKAAGWNRVGIRAGQSALNHRATINLIDGSIIGATAGTAVVANVGNGWWRIAISGPVTTTSYQIVVEPHNTGIVQGAETPDGYSGIYIWGAQLEAGAKPTSYIPTVASQVTRSADSASDSTIDDWYRADQGTFYVEAMSDEVGSRRVFAVSDGTYSQRLSSYFGAATHFRGESVSSGFNIDLDAGTQTAGVFGKLAASYAIGAQAVSLNGGTVASTANTRSMPLVDRFFIGADAFNASRLNGHIRKIAFYPKASTPAQLQALTS
jgi:hypothetical protein